MLSLSLHGINTKPPDTSNTKNVYDTTLVTNQLIPVDIKDQNSLAPRNSSQSQIETIIKSTKAVSNIDICCTRTPSEFPRGYLALVHDSNNT